MPYQNGKRIFYSALCFVEQQLKQLSYSALSTPLKIAIDFFSDDITMFCSFPSFLQICHQHKGVYLHSDIAQMAGKLPINVDEMGIDLASISSHKVTDNLLQHSHNSSNKII